MVSESHSMSEYLVMASAVFSELCTENAKLKLELARLEHLLLIQDNNIYNLRKDLRQQTRICDILKEDIDHMRFMNKYLQQKLFDYFNETNYNCKSQTPGKSNCPYDSMPDDEIQSGSSFSEDSLCEDNENLHASVDNSGTNLVGIFCDKAEQQHFLNRFFDSGVDVAYPSTLSNQSIAESGKTDTLKHEKVVSIIEKIQETRENLDTVTRTIKRLQRIPMRAVKKYHNPSLSNKNRLKMIAQNDDWIQKQMNVLKIDAFLPTSMAYVDKIKERGLLDLISCKQQNSEEEYFYSDFDIHLQNYIFEIDFVKYLTPCIT